MRALLLTFVIVCSAAAQSAPGPTIAVVDQNGVAVVSARVSLQAPPATAVRCETDHTGRCSFPGTPAGPYVVRVEKEGFYAFEGSAVQLTPGGTVEVGISRLQEIREIVNVRESPPAIDP